MFCIEPKLLDRPADLVRNGSFRRGSGPAVATAGVLELQTASVREIQYPATECTVDRISSDVLLGVIGKVHDSRLTKVVSGQSEILRRIGMFLALFIILLVLWIFGFAALHVASAAIHLLLILAVVSLIVHFVRPHTRPPAA